MNLRKKCTVSKDTVIYETFPFQILLAFFWDLALLSPTTDKSRLAWVVIGTICINTVFVLSILYIVSHRKSLFQTKKSKNNPYIFLIMGTFVVCFTTILNSWLNLDGHIYYKCIRDLKEWNFSWNQLMLAGHMSQGYTIFLTNDLSYLKKPGENTEYKEFSIHKNAIKTGTLNWNRETL